jgi:hypothetical protein
LSEKLKSISAAIQSDGVAMQEYGVRNIVKFHRADEVPTATAAPLKTVS